MLICYSGNCYAISGDTWKSIKTFTFNTFKRPDFFLLSYRYTDDVDYRHGRDIVNNSNFRYDGYNGQTVRKYLSDTIKKITLGDKEITVKKFIPKKVEFKLALINIYWYNRNHGYVMDFPNGGSYLYYKDPKLLYYKIVYPVLDWKEEREE